jgi:hypothetical protein
VCQTNNFWKRLRHTRFLLIVSIAMQQKNLTKDISLLMLFCKKTSYDDMLRFDKITLKGLLRDYIVHLRHNKRLAFASVSLYIAAIAHFYEMNDVTINWKKLKKFKAKNRYVVEDRPYSREQIKTPRIYQPSLLIEI